MPYRAIKKLNLFYYFQLISLTSYNTIVEWLNWIITFLLSVLTFDECVHQDQFVYTIYAIRTLLLLSVTQINYSYSHATLEMNWL